MIKIDENLTVTSPVGFKASGIHCGLKKSLLKKDLALIYSDVVATSCGVYTKNKVKGAPLTITKQHLIIVEMLTLVMVMMVYQKQKK